MDFIPARIPNLNKGCINYFETIEYSDYVMPKGKEGHSASGFAQFLSCFVLGKVQFDYDGRRSPKSKEIKFRKAQTIDSKHNPMNETKVEAPVVDFDISGSISTRGVSDHSELTDRQYLDACMLPLPTGGSLWEWESLHTRALDEHKLTLARLTYRPKDAPEFAKRT
ncbi:hypothetical protein AMTR_s00125p00106050 [Amborella trichopoda]|uniref:Uncharacterized protein n=1 Tax=Amborella trichopoda TaxID=13333 RepID=W1NQ17_AMBTC|nr:hypothetical protein AMTR_s00125p00106050 [Amborella trichopoda]